MGGERVGESEIPRGVRGERVRRQGEEREGEGGANLGTGLGKRWGSKRTASNSLKIFLERMIMYSKGW